jgi:hypothetical protein
MSEEACIYFSIPLEFFRRRVGMFQEPDTPYGSHGVNGSCCTAAAFGSEMVKYPLRNDGLFAAGGLLQSDRSAQRPGR